MRRHAAARHLQATTVAVAAHLAQAGEFCVLDATPPSARALIAGPSCECAVRVVHVASCCRRYGDERRERSRSRERYASRGDDRRGPGGPPGY